MPDPRDAIAQAISETVEHSITQKGPMYLRAADAVLPFVARARAEGYQAAISDARKAVEALPISRLAIRADWDEMGARRKPDVVTVDRDAVLSLLDVAVFDKLPVGEEAAGQ